MKKPVSPFVDWHKLTAFQQLNAINDMLLTIDVSPGMSAEYMILMAKTMDAVIQIEERMRQVKRLHD